MQPMRLELCAFGPFAKPVEVDFQRLRAHGLYLIWGPTGSGKSTLLDGIAFALYGETSGRERTPEELRSDHAAPEAETRVTFDFLLGRDAFRVSRTPRYERPKLRGEGTTTVQPTAELHRLVADGEGWIPGECLFTRVTDVTRAVEERLGFSAAQFRQVILLPQGRFRELLSATTPEREAILKRLFDTSQHERLQRALKERADGMARTATETRERRRGVLEAADCEDDDALRSRLERTLADLDRLGAAAAAAKAEADRARQAYDDAKRIVEQHRELEVRRAELRELEEEREAIEGQRAEVAQIRRALAMADLSAAEARAGRQLERARKARDAAKAAQDEALRTLTRARAELERSESAAPERERLDARVRDLEAVAGRLDGWLAAVSDRDRVREQRSAAESRERQAAEELAAMERRAADLAEAVDELRDRSAELPAARLLVRQAEEQRSAQAAAQEAAEALSVAQADLAAAREATSEARARRDDADHRVSRIREAFLAAQARLLAEELEPGRPCPVCGSPDHPDPARGTLPAVRREDVDEAEAALAKRDRTLESRAGEADALARSVAALQARIPENFQPGREAELSAAEAEARARLAAAEEAGSVLPARQQALADARSARARAADAKAACAAALASGAQALSAAEARVAERAEGIPEPLRSRDALDREQVAARQAAAAAAKAHRQALDAVAGADRAEVEARTAAAHAKDALSQARGEHERNAAALATRMTAAGFQDLAVLRALIERGDEVASLEKTVADHDRRRDAAAAVVGDLARRLGEGRPAALEPLADTLATADQRHGAAQEAQVLAEEAVRRDRGYLEQLARIDRELDELDRTYGIVASLAEVANDRTMTFQRHVLAVLLDRVLLLASTHLERMSRGRYQLRRSLEAPDGRSHGGLDLEVDDAYTGKTRGVSTLSGGEGFMTALALALGLSETVQSLAGGVRLDALFVDEGFGSLDEEALDLALETLLGLRAGGRTVGVISHVGELPQRIDARIDVLKRQDGSSVRLVLP